MSLARRAALSALALAVAALSSCSASACPVASPGLASNDCSGEIEFGDRVYVIQYLDHRIPTDEVLEKKLVRGQALPCDDTADADCSGGSASRSVPIAAVRIRGIPADEALLRSSDRFGRKALLVPADTSYAPVISARVQRLIDRYRTHPRHGPFAAQESARK
ncbi:hypothetical protein H5V45_02070 [Nocardioides sp. KIGAM211]|uniref:Uncharacterized protein n=1 Tax=Nocardioides luti TaxID=2761101 RepID=A0A7X0V9M6_9ACTN|nr:hypothetical protein [Nocardioides luti]MBB6626097.1 hypothetical protein [Nocardioides luti]